MMLNGLVVRKLSDYPGTIPQPLCAMERMPVEGSTYDLVYLVPADQIEI